MLGLILEWFLIRYLHLVLYPKSEDRITVFPFRVFFDRVWLKCFWEPRLNFSDKLGCRNTVCFQKRKQPNRLPLQKHVLYRALAAVTLQSWKDDRKAEGSVILLWAADLIRIPIRLKYVNCIVRFPPPLCVSTDGQTLTANPEQWIMR